MSVKTQGVMSCRQCPRYDRTLSRCLNGKANPRRKSDVIAVAEVLGLRAICSYNPHRDALAIRIHYPYWPLLPSVRRSRSVHARTIEIEIEPEAAP